MKILFNRKWNKNDIRNVVKNNCYLRFGDHEDLKALCICPFPYSDYAEMIFIVPTKWLKKVAYEIFEVEDLDYWLQNEYTTDESELIFERALNERQVVAVDF